MKRSGLGQLWLSAALMWSVFVTPLAWGQVDRQVNRAEYARVVSGGVQFLIAKGQDPQDGSFSKQLGPAVTAMCTTALIRHGQSLESQPVKSGLAYLEKYIQEDGGVYADGSNLRNYETSVAIMCFQAANDDHRYDRIIEQAVLFLKGIQWDGGEGHPRSSAHFGGQGYGKHKRPDMSNTSFFIDALKAANDDPESAAMQKALLFVSRTQNLSSENNRQPFAQVIETDDRGGFIYTPVGPESKAGESTTGGLRSYASMTYAGLKSFLYAGVDKDDVRVQAAMDWIARHYDLKSNPGMGSQGLYYYYHVFAKALDTYGQPTIQGADDKEHHWRSDLVAELKQRQRDDGSWINEADRWYEGDPNLVTSYALLALSYCHPDRE